MKFINQPYHHAANPKNHVRMAMLFGGFVFVFLRVFLPFGLSSYQGNVVGLTLGYGAVCTIVMLCLNVVFPLFWPKIFASENWTVGKEIMWTTLNILLIGVGNAYYTTQVGAVQLSFQRILIFEFYTLAIGVFPIAIGILMNERRLRNKYNEGSATINEAIKNKHSHVAEVTPANNKTFIQIPSENAGESFAIHPESLLYAKAAENYAEIFIATTGSSVTRKIIRTNMLALESALQQHPQFLRCHKSYIVNLAAASHISGNAQGFKIHLKQVENVIPVSRKFNSSIKQLLLVFA